MCKDYKVSILHPSRWLIFTSDDTINLMGFSLTYACAASVNAVPSCGAGKAVITSVVQTYGNGSDVSWAVAKVRLRPIPLLSAPYTDCWVCSQTLGSITPIPTT